MKPSIIESTVSFTPWLPWLSEGQCQALQAWEQAQVDAHVVDAFGFHAVQVAGLSLQALRANRMPHRWSVATEFEPSLSQQELALTGVQARVDSLAWPWAQDSLDLVCMPHVLERSDNPHATLREAHRVLMPEGKLVLTGLNPWSFWGGRYRAWRRQHFAGEGGAPVQLLSPGRLKDWLRLLGFELESVDFGLWLPPRADGSTARPWAWLDRHVAKVAEPLGSVYCISAIKKVHSMRPIKGASWKPAGTGQVAAVPLARTSVKSVATSNYQQEGTQDA